MLGELKEDGRTNCEVWTKLLRSKLWLSRRRNSSVCSL